MHEQLLATGAGGPPDMTKMSWTTAPALRYSFHHDAVSYADAAYWVGGYDGSAAQKWFYKFSRIGGWVALPNMPTARMGHSSVVVDGKLYVIGGAVATASNYTGLVECYDFATQTWSTLAACPIISSYGDACAVGRKIYYFGGMTSSASGELPASFIQQCYDIDTNTWSTLTTGISARLDAGVCAFEDKVYIVGGRYNSVYYRQLWEYNTTTGVTTAKALPPVAYGCRRAFQPFLGKLVTLFGFTTPSAGYNGTNSYDPATDTWATLATSAGYRAMGGSAVLGNTIFYFSGIKNATGQADSLRFG